MKIYSIFTKATRLEPHPQIHLHLLRGRYNTFLHTITIIISITRAHICKNTGGLCCSGTKCFFTSDFGSLTLGERHTSYYANHPQRTSHFVMFKISLGRDLQNSNYVHASTVEKSILYVPMAENSSICFRGRNSTICLHGPMSTINWRFFKILKFSAHLFWA